MALRSASIRHIRSQVAWPSSRRLTWSGAGSRSVAQCTGRQEVPEYSDYLILSEEDLWNQCQMETFRASGPGGQHRNKTDTAVRVRHLPTGTTATATEQRSQKQNRSKAFERLRWKIALSVRRPPPFNPIDSSSDSNYDIPDELAAILPTRAKRKRLGAKHYLYPLGIQVLLDILVASNLSVADCARSLGLSTGALSRLITSDNQLLAEVNRLRQGQGMRPLRKSK